MPKRRLQRGHVYKDGNVWRVRWWEDVRQVDGSLKKVRRSEAVGPAVGKNRLGKKEAQKAADEQVLDKLNEKAWVPQSLVTLAQFVAQRFNPEVTRHMKKAGQVHYAYILSKILPLIGQVPLRDLDIEVAQGLVNTVEHQGFSTQTIKHVRNALSAVIEHAKRLKMFTGDNPARLVKTPPVVRKKKPALTWEQAQKVLMLAPEPYRTMALMSMTTSVNIAEMKGLRWGRVNLTDQTVVLVQDDVVLPPRSFAVIENHYRGEYGTVKTGNRNRVQPIPDRLRNALEGLQGGVRTGVGTADMPVFASRTGRPIDDKNANKRVWKRVGAAAGVPGLSWHSFRRTASTLTEQVGMDKADRIALMGHGSAAMTDYYTDSDIERRRGYLDKMSQQLATPQAPTASKEQEITWTSPRMGQA